MVVVHTFAGSDKGAIRPNNEDAFLLHAPQSEEIQWGRGILAVVADGVGGSACGERASQMAVTTLRECYDRGLEENAAFSIRDAFLAANAAIHHTAANDPQCRGMATTCTALLIQGSTGIIGHVGDSRAYLLRHGELHQLTTDHTLVNSLVRDGLLPAEEAKNHPRKNVILKALGHLPEVCPDVFEINISQGDSLILCSDGLYALVANEDIISILGEFSVRDAGQKLIELAKKRGGFDNITLVIITIDQVRHPLESALTTATTPIAASSTPMRGWVWLSILTAFLGLAAAFAYILHLL
jgi:protein phosphatase